MGVERRARQPHYLRPRRAVCCSVSLSGAPPVDARPRLRLRSHHTTRLTPTPAPGSVLTGATPTGRVPRGALPNDLVVRSG